MIQWHTIKIKINSFICTHFCKHNFEILSRGHKCLFASVPETKKLLPIKKSIKQETLSCLQLAWVDTRIGKRYPERSELPQKYTLPDWVPAFCHQLEVGYQLLSTVKSF